MHTDPSRGFTRRALLGSALAAGGLLLAGCNADTTRRVTAQPAAPTGPPRRGGRFRFAPTGFGKAITTDPQTSATSFSLMTAFTDTLVERDHSWGIRPALAEEFAPEGKDLGTWTIRLRDGVTFHNGKPLTAADVIHTIRRNLDPQNPGFVSGLLNAIDPHAIDVLDPRTLRLHLKYPNSLLPEGFAEAPSAILPEGFDPEHPIGTGPFKQLSFTPEQRWVGVRNQDYWKEGRPYLDQLELLGFTNDETARGNALLSGQVDGIDQVPSAQLGQVRTRHDIDAFLSQTGDFEMIEMRCDKGAQFEDPRVRKAFKLMVDRQQMVDIVYDGYGAVGNDVGSWALFDPTYDSSLPQRAQDLDQARSLLKAAGQEGMRVTFRVGPVEPGAQEAAELMMQYASAAGVTLTLDVVADMAQFYGGQDYQTAQLKNDYDYTQSIYDNASYCWLPTGPFNNTGYDSARVGSLYRQALATTGAVRTELLHEVAREVWDDGPWIVWGRRNHVDAYRTAFTGASADASGIAFNGGRWDEISLS